MSTLISMQSYTSSQQRHLLTFTLRYLADEELFSRNKDTPQTRIGMMIWERSGFRTRTDFPGVRQHQALPPLLVQITPEGTPISVLWLKGCGLAQFNQHHLVNLNCLLPFWNSSVFRWPSCQLAGPIGPVCDHNLSYIPGNR